MSVTAKDIIATFEQAVPNEVLAKLDPSRPILEQGVDSLALTVIAVALQDTFKIKMSVEESIKLKTINDIVAYVNGKIG